EKNGQGKWAVARIFVRIGIGQKVISNVNQGGGIADLKPFLQANYPDNWENIRSNIRKVAKDFPYEIERLSNNTFTTMGIDVGIDKDGHPYVFEVNSFPTVTPQLAQVAMLRAEHYKYMLDNLNKK